MKGIYMTNAQMELGFGTEPPVRPASRRQLRLERAAWWFGQMRRAVDRAMDWRPTPAGPPQQTWLPGTRREARV